jgi:hypothetical protein
LRADYGEYKRALSRCFSLPPARSSPPNGEETPKWLDYPLMGVVKVEVPLAAGGMLDGDLVDRLSRCLVAERTVAPHGRDPRWHAHLYPIHVAERAIRVGFVSHEVLRAAIQWPSPPEASA